MNQMEVTLRTINNKLFIIIVSFIFCAVLISSRLYYLQIYCSQELYDLSQRNCTRIKSISSPRGNIVDCNGKLLATNRPLINIIWDGSGNRKLTAEQEENLKKLCTILNFSFDDEDFVNNIKSAEKSSKQFTLAEDITFEELSKISELFSDDKNIKIISSFKRFYPYQQIACHVLGYLSQESIEYIGKMGLEQIFEDLLRGQQGKILSTINATGKKISQEEILQSISGQTIKTCLDLEIQNIAEEAFPQDFAGCMIIMDPTNGDIKALLSRPNFDPNIFLKSISYDEWQILQKEKPFINRACNAAYPPASIFKLVSIITALEEKIIDENTITYCCGHTLFAGRKYHCAKKEGHGPLNIKDAFAKSCNILFFEIGKKLKINTIASYAKRFGLGEKSGIILTEKLGLIPTNEWKLKKIGERWWPGETLSAIIGQSYTLVTPIQVVRMMGSIFTGYLVKPRILETEEIIKTPIDINNSSLKFLQGILKKVVKTGTGVRMNLNDIEVFAKTGTAQTSDLEKRDLGKAYLEHAWVACHFYYKDYSPLSMVIFVENAGGTGPAITASKKVILRYRNMMKAKERI